MLHPDHIAEINLAAVRAHEAREMGMFRPGEYWTQALPFPLYMVEVTGKVMSLVRPGKPRILKPIARGRYGGFTLRHWSGRMVGVYHHRLVAEAMHGPCPDGMECRHLDGDRFNNDACNLAWGTHLENEADRRAHGRTASGERNFNAKLTRAQVEEMRAIRARTGLPHKRIAEMFGVSTMTAHRACTGRSWS